MEEIVDRVVLPGDVLNILQDKSDKKLRLGPGLRYNKDEVVAEKAGLIRYRSSRTYWIDTSQKRYIPVEQERVIGVVVNKSGDNYNVDVGGSSHAILPYLRFGGASTKRNRFNIEIGDLVFARFVLADKYKELELSFVNQEDKSNGLSKLEDGFMFRLPLESVRRLSSSDKTVIQLVGERIPFEVAIGMNGRVWINSSSIELTISFAKLISDCQYLHQQQIEKEVKEYFNKLPRS